MSIIPQQEIQVKDYESRVSKHFKRNYAQKWEEKKIQTKKIAGLMMSIGERARAGRMLECGEIVKMEVCQNCGTSHLVYSNLCRDRFCPICKWRLSMKRFATMLNIVESLRRGYPESTWQFVTLTVQNCRPDELSAVMDEMSRAWNCVVSGREFKRYIAGFARSTEITYNAEKGTVHPHFHVLLMYNELMEPTFPLAYKWITAVRRYAAIQAQDTQTIAWEAVSEDEREIGWQVDQNPEDQRAIEAILETFKYATKDKDLEEMPLGTFREVVKALANRRLVSFGGKVKEYAAILEAGNLNDLGKGEEKEEETNIDICVHCRSRDLIEVVGRWSGGAYEWRRTEA